MASLKLDAVSCGYDGHPVVQDVDLELKPGDFIALIGPNAAGKSTLLKVMTRVLRPLRGRVLLDGRDLWRMPPSAVARRVAAVGQEAPADFPLCVQDLVLMGRLPHLERFRAEGPRDVGAARRAMSLTGTLALAGRDFTGLSAGERQRVLIARALAQEPAYLLLDEPTAHLDIAHQVELLDLLCRLNRDTGLGVLVVLHDLNLAALYCDRLVLLHQGRVSCRGSAEEVLVPPRLQDVYGSRVVVSRHPVHGVPQVSLIAAAHDPTCGQGLPRGKVHVVGGGGSASWLLEALVTAGFRVSTGALNRGDSDWTAARALGLETVEVAPFSPVDAAAGQRNAAAAIAADWVVLADVPFGHGNLANLEAVRRAVLAEVPVVLVEATPLEERDYTGGRALEVYRELRKRAYAVAASDLEALRLLTGVERDAPRRERILPDGEKR